MYDDDKFGFFNYTDIVPKIRAVGVNAYKELLQNLFAIIK